MDYEGKDNENENEDFADLEDEYFVDELLEAFSHLMHHLNIKNETSWDILNAAGALTTRAYELGMGSHDVSSAMIKKWTAAHTRSLQTFKQPALEMRANERMVSKVGKVAAPINAYEGMRACHLSVISGESSPFDIQLWIEGADFHGNLTGRLYPALIDGQPVGVPWKKVIDPEETAREFLRIAASHGHLRAQAWCKEHGIAFQE